MKTKTTLVLVNVSTLMVTLIASFYMQNPAAGPELGSTEVQSYRYRVMGGMMDTAGQLGILPAWHLGDWAMNAGVPFATRSPYLTPVSMWQNITFSDRDPTTGVVNLTVSAESYVGLDHTFWDPRNETYLRFRILLQEEGCGCIFTGEGETPILGDVDIITFNNNTGIYSSKPGYEGEPMTPETCLQNLRGPDGIPGTDDDPIGDGTPDPKGSSILYLPTKLSIEYWDETAWQLLVLTPFPMLMTTGRAYDVVIEPDSEIDGEESEEVGRPWQYLFDCLPWEDPECNVKVTYVCSWSKLEIPTAFGLLDLMWEVTEYKVREDRWKILRGDANCDQIVDFKDLFLTARAYGEIDEGFGKPTADSHFDARCDCWNDGRIDLYDLIPVSSNYRYVHGYHIPDFWQGTISVDPSSVTADVGQTFEVNITVSDVTDLYLVVFGISWDPTVLSLTNITPGPFLPGPATDVVAVRNDAEGYLEGWTMTSLYWVEGSSGSGVVATLEFEGVGSGSSALDLYNCSWMNSNADQYGFETKLVREFRIYWSRTDPYIRTCWNSFTIESESTLASVNFNRTRKRISFTITSETTGFCNVTIPRNLIDHPFELLINETAWNHEFTVNATHCSLYFTYASGTNYVKIIGTHLYSLDGDINLDGEVDIYDAIMLSGNYGLKEEPDLEVDP